MGVLIFNRVIADEHKPSERRRSGYRVKVHCPCPHSRRYENCHRKGRVKLVDFCFDQIMKLALL